MQQLYDDEPTQAQTYESLRHSNEECYQRLTALLERRAELPVWAVEAIEDILEEVL